MESVPNISQLTGVPVMSRELFAQNVGVSLDVVNGWVNRGYLPTFEMGRYRLINVALLSKMTLEKEFSL
ncbi:MAG: hypothetical protein K8H75_08800 [Sulfuricella sp.]|nr:hypothetical protein [Sulfuricella sp.]